MTIVEFLLARIAEDEAMARAAIRFTDAYDDEPSDDGDRWEFFARPLRWSPDTPVASVWTEQQMVAIPPKMLWKPEQVMEHIARHDPARVLAECAAKRAIVALHPPTEHVCVGVAHEWAGIRNVPEPCEFRVWICATLVAMASVYVGHPDYDPAWLPMHA